MKKQLGPKDTFFPTPVTLVVSGSMDNPNIITIAWAGMLCSSPPTFAVSMTSQRHSTEIIRKYGEFTVNIPSAGQASEVDYCGIVSGRHNNKFSQTQFTPVQGTKVSAPIIQECVYNLECKVVQEISLGDFVVFLGEVVETHIDAACLDSNGKILLEKADPLVYAAGLREYWQLGAKTGDAFSIGKTLKNSPLL